MKILFEIDTKDYDLYLGEVIRPSARAIIIKDHKLGLLYSNKNKYYKSLGGGIEENETLIQALQREIYEESGYSLIPESIKEFGKIIRKTSFPHDRRLFSQINYYYIVEIDESNKRQVNFDEHEKEELFYFTYVDPKVALEENQKASKDDVSLSLIERENKIINILLEEKLI